MTATLLIPKIEVIWGSTNLTSYSGDGFNGDSIVYKVEFHLEKQNNAPTASMMWNPSGAAFAVYEKMLEKNLKEKIYITIYYEGGRKFKTTWVWSGQGISYGNDMTVKVAMQSLLASDVNSTVRSANQAKEKDGITYKEGIENLSGMWKVDKGIVQWSEKAKEEAEKAKLKFSYSANSTFGSAVTQHTSAMGHQTFASNIGDRPASFTVFRPYSIGGEKVYDPSEIKAGESPDVAKRYGYLLGPGVINHFERTYTWIPPQQDNSNSPATTPKPINTKKKDKKKEERGQSHQQTNTERKNQERGATPGTSSNSTNPAVRDKNNPYGPKNQIAAKEEEEAKLQFTTFLVPLLVGVKPHDIVFVPSLKGDYIEDWIVNSVDYNQTDGGVEISIGATRAYGLSKTMNEEGSKPFQEKAKKLSEAGLSAWDRYAWGLSFNSTQRA